VSATTSHVVAITAVHNRLACTQRCLASLREGTSTAHLSIIVVDDGSTDGTGEWLSSQLPDIITLTGDGSLWFGGATQWAIAYTISHFSTADYVLILNNDTFVRPGAIDEMIAASNHRFSVAAALWLEDLKVVGTGGFLWHWARGLSDASAGAQWRVAHASGRRGFMSVSAVATTCALHPIRRLKDAALVDITKHPQNRYDALLSANIREAGGRFLASYQILADHLYGPPQSRPTLRNLGFRGFWDATFRDARSVYHLPFSLDATWHVAPTPWHALPVIGRQLMLFLRAVVGTSVRAVVNWKRRPS